MQLPICYQVCFHTYLPVFALLPSGFQFWVLMLTFNDLHGLGSTLPECLLSWFEPLIVVRLEV